MPQRLPLAPISGNHQANTELSPGQKEHVCGQYQAGKTFAKIAKAEALLYSTVYNLINCTLDHGTTANSPCSGHPKTVTDHDCQHILLLAHLYPKYTYKQLCNDTGLPYCKNTFRKVLKENSLTNSYCYFCLELNEDKAWQRLEFA